ncbi:MAG: DUF2007 domain-containing protein [Muribaculaceae bacterium]|nr:DUF2007 domain-containing protein [Muribaculaceae bacterium]
MDENDLIIVATFDYDWQAHMAQGLLAEQQIVSTLDNEIFASIYPIGFNSIGGINLRVFRRDADRAREIINKSQL